MDCIIETDCNTNFMIATFLVSKRLIRRIPLQLTQCETKEVPMRQVVWGSLFLVHIKQDVVEGSGNEIAGIILRIYFLKTPVRNLIFW